MKDKSSKMRQQNNSSNKNGTFYDPKAINDKNHLNKKKQKSSAINVLTLSALAIRANNAQIRVLYILS